MIELSIANGIAEITLNEPSKLNALDDRAFADLASAYSQAAESGCRALLLRAEGRAFCAGRDISGVEATTDDGYAFLADVVTPVLRQISEFPAPTFAAAQGAALGVGLGLLIATDVVYLSETARIGSPFAAIGATLDSGGHAYFFERLGAHRTLDLIFTGELMSGTSAVASGLFSRAVADDALLTTARAAAAAAESGPSQAFLASKRIIARLRDERVGLWASIDDENREQGRLGASQDYHEGFLAFQQKRKPAFGAAE